MLNFTLKSFKVETNRVNIKSTILLHIYVHIFYDFLENSCRFLCLFFIALFMLSTLSVQYMHGL